MAMPVLVSAALGTAPPQRAGMVSGAVNTFRQLGFALGIAILGTVFTQGMQSAGAHAGPGVGYVHGLTRVSLVAGIVAVATGLLVLAVVRNRPADRDRPADRTAAAAAGTAGSDSGTAGTGTAAPATAAAGTAVGADRG
ncbi:MFS transporter OS=Streptomyces rimosus subsp. rimosus (strain ATCC / DSM 40260 / JCM 4667 /NRRL 2234) OX=1265868 GN=SRIM_021665 PE=4 SV=1 [Streptomyces rimosus subsp. rimosus]